MEPRLAILAVDVVHLEMVLVRDTNTFDGLQPHAGASPLQCTTRNDVEPQCVANWLTPEISKALAALPNDASLALVGSRFVLTIRGIHLESVATALEVVLCAALGRSVAPLRR